MQGPRSPGPHPWEAYRPVWRNRLEGQAEPPLVRSECFAKASVMLFSQLTWYLVVLGIFIWSPPLPLSPLSLNCKAFKDTDCLYFIFISICGSASHRVASLHWCVEVRMGWNQSGREAGPLQPRAVRFLQDAHPTPIFIPENVNWSLRCCLLRKTFMIFLTVHVFLGFWVSVLCTSPVVWFVLLMSLGDMSDLVPWWVNPLKLKTVFYSHLYLP